MMKKCTFIYPNTLGMSVSRYQFCTDGVRGISSHKVSVILSWESKRVNWGKTNLQNALPYGSKISGADPEQVILILYLLDPEILLKLWWDPDTCAVF